MNNLLSVILITFTYFIEITPLQYEPNWESIDSRASPDWFDHGKIGIFIHWGVYSVPSVTSEWLWVDWKGKQVERTKQIIDYMSSNYKPGFTYQDFASKFTGEFFDPNEWADIIEKSGARYVVMTSKHHDGFTMWPSKYAYSWNSVDVGLHRDVIGELQKAVTAKSSLKFGLYYSLYEGFNPLYLADKESSFSTNKFIEEKIKPEMKDLVTKYKPDVFWSDGEWEAPNEYWKSEEFLSWLFNESPVKDSVVVNDRWGKDTLCSHGGYTTCADKVSTDKIPTRKWENTIGLDKTGLGYNRKSNVQDYLTTQELIDTLVRTVALGGNLLINIGPSKDGKIIPIEQERLSDLGKWLAVNGEAIYDSTPWERCKTEEHQADIWYTTKPGKDYTTDLYISLTKWPKSGIIILNCPDLNNNSKITLLGLPGHELKVTRLVQRLTTKHFLQIRLPERSLIETDYVWVFKLNNVI